MTVRILLIIYLGFFLSEKVCAQNTDRAIENIKVYVRMADSLSGIETYLKIQKEEQVRLVASISEGAIENAKKGLKGGFSIVTVTSRDNDTVFSITKHDNLKKNLTQSYYFKSDKLVFCRIEVQDDNDSNAILFHQEEFYQDDKVILSRIDKNELRKKYKWRIDFDHMKSGYFYLKDFKNGRP